MKARRQVRAEVSQCQRWVELRIGEWLGPAKEGFKGNQYSASSPGEEAKIHDRHKHEFRFLAEHKEIVTDILKNNPGKEITRAWLIAAIEDALLVSQGAREGSEWRSRQNVPFGTPCVTTAAPEEHPAGLFLHHLKPRLLRVLHFGLLVPHFNEPKEHLHYQRANLAFCVQLLKRAPCILRQSAELGSESLLELAPRLGVPSALLFFQCGGHSLAGHYRGKFGIAVFQQGHPCFKPGCLW
jgi:hypothetical protein